MSEIQEHRAGQPQVDAWAVEIPTVHFDKTGWTADSAKKMGVRNNFRCKFVQWCCDGRMDGDFQQRARWLARNILPHEALIRSRVSHMCGPHISIDDVVQEMYARILSVPSVDDIRHPRQYAILTAKSIVVDHLRRARVVPLKYCDNLDQLGAMYPQANAEERIEFQEEIQEVVSVLAQLPPACREVLILRRIEGLSQKEVARRLGVSEKMIEKHMARGARVLAELLSRGGKSKGDTSSGQSATSVKSTDVQFGD